MNNQVYDVLILGGGPSGLTGAIYTARAGLSTIVLAGNPPGGQLMWTSEVENFPGFPKGISGPELVNQIRLQAIRFHVKVVDENAVEVRGGCKEGFEVLSDSKVRYHSRTVIIATGASARWLGLPSEQHLRGKGVSACATCDGPFFKNKVVAVVGAGDSGLEEATYLTNFVEKAYVLVRGSEKKMRASKIMQERAHKNPKIEFMFDTEVVDVLGNHFVTGLRVQNNVTGEIKIMDDVRGLFVAIGHKPNTDFLLSEGGSVIELGTHGYAVPKMGTATHTIVDGIFIAGDVSDHKYKQAVTAAGFGCMAALDCIKFLSENP